MTNLQPEITGLSNILTLQQVLCTSTLYTGIYRKVKYTNTKVNNLTSLKTKLKHAIISDSRYGYFILAALSQCKHYHREELCQISSAQ